MNLVSDKETSPIQNRLYRHEPGTPRKGRLRYDITLKDAQAGLEKIAVLAPVVEHKPVTARIVIDDDLLEEKFPILPEELRPAYQLRSVVRRERIMAGTIFAASAIASAIIIATH